MIHITFIHPDGEEQTVEAPENWSILQIAKHYNIEGLEGVCGGCMACGTCHVYIPADWQSRVNEAGNEKSEEEEDTLDMAFHVTEESRLGCQIEITKALDGLKIKLPPAGR